MLKTEGAVVLEIQLNSRMVVRRHKDQVRPKVVDAAITVPASPDDVATNESQSIHPKQMILLTSQFREMARTMQMSQNLPHSLQKVMFVLVQ